MVNIELINLVTTRLVQQKKEINFQLKNVVEKGDDVNNVLLTLREYRKVIDDIQLWETIIDEIMTPSDDIEHSGVEK